MARVRYTNERFVLILIFPGLLSFPGIGNLTAWRFMGISKNQSSILVYKNSASSKERIKCFETIYDYEEISGFDHVAIKQCREGVTQCTKLGMPAFYEGFCKYLIF